MLLVVLMAIAAGCGRSELDLGGSASTRGVAPDASREAAPDADTTTDAAVEDAPCTPVTIESRQPPARSTAPRAPTFTRWFEISSIDLGIADASAWIANAWDLDRRTTIACEGERALRTCRGKPARLIDGPGGVDGNFSRFVLPAIEEALPGIQALTSGSIVEGGLTLLLRLDDLEGLDDDDHVPGALYVTGHETVPPTFTVSDQRFVERESLIEGGSVDAPKVRFPDGYFVRGTWVSGPPAAPMTITLPLFGGHVALPIVGARIVFRLGAPPFAGTLSGVVPVATAMSALEPSLRAIGVCPGTPSFLNVAAAMRDACDLVGDAPSFQAEGRACDAISLGLGFTAPPTSAPRGVHERLPLPVRCPP